MRSLSLRYLKNLTKRGYVLLTFILISLLLLIHVRRLNDRVEDLQEHFKLSFDELSDDLNARIEASEEYIELTTTADAASLNNTKKAMIEVLVFNRVPKVGSMMILDLMLLLGARNNYSVFRAYVDKNEVIVMSQEQQADLAGVISDLDKPSSFMKHFAYLDFTKFNKPKPIYINLVRDPVERVISWFYYTRQAWIIVLNKMNHPNASWPEVDYLRKDFETCVKSHDSECNYIEGSMDRIMDHRRQMFFYCGSDPECQAFNSPIALHRAQQNVENEYAVVGLLEDLNTTLAVLENYIPRFFAGATEVYYKNLHDLRLVNKNVGKPIISEEIKNMIRMNMSREFEFYEFCKRRLKLQFKALNKN